MCSKITILGKNTVTGGILQTNDVPTMKLWMSDNNCFHVLEQSDFNNVVV